jgi:quinol monooxygenase YgiN
MADFVHEIDIAANADAVRNLISSHGDKWWTTNAVIDDREGGACEFRFPSAGFHAVVRVIKNTPGLVEWHCIGSILPPAALKATGGTDAREWVGTTIRFHLATIGAASTRVRLEHLGLGASAQFYSTQNNVWAFYLDSLRSLAETGTGSPFQGGRPGTDTEGLVALAVAFKVKPDQIDEATRAIAAFIDHIEKNEPDTLVYRSYQDAEDPTSFIHYMIFRSAEAHHKHRDSVDCADFVKKLYPCCVETPRSTPLTLYREAALGSPPAP